MTKLQKNKPQRMQTHAKIFQKKTQGDTVHFCGFPTCCFSRNFAAN